MTLGDFADEFLKPYAKTNSKPSEQKNKKLILNRHLLPAFRHVHLDDIWEHEVEKLKAELLDGKRSRKTVNNVLACLGKILRYAHEIELLERVPRIRLLVLADAEGNPFNLEVMRWNLPRLCRKAGIARVGWHALRHTFCSHLALRGAPSRLIQELAGHASLATTLRYMRLVPGATDDAIALLNDRPGNGVATEVRFSSPSTHSTSVPMV